MKSYIKEYKNGNSEDKTMINRTIMTNEIILTNIGIQEIKTLMNQTNNI